jgi:hypothetical protein
MQPMKDKEETERAVGRQNRAWAYCLGPYSRTDQNVVQTVLLLYRVTVKSLRTDCN